MCDKTYGSGFEQRVDDLARQSSAWFKGHPQTDVPWLFVRYVAESQAGRFKQHYSCLLDDSMECLIGVLPMLAKHLAIEVGRVIHLPQHQIRPILSLIVYWLIQAHTDKKSGVPEQSQMLDIINGILSDRFLSFKK